MDLGVWGTAAPLSCLSEGVSACGPHHSVNYFASAHLKKVIVALRKGSNSCNIINSI